MKEIPEKYFAVRVRLCTFVYVCVLLPEMFTVYINLNVYFHKPCIKSSSPFGEGKTYQIFLSLSLLESCIL